MAKITELEEAKGDHPHAAIMTAAVALVSSRRTAPDSTPDALPPHMPILTAPGRLATAHEVLRASGGLFYSRGALSIAGALACADLVESWDAFQAQVKTELAEMPDHYDNFTPLSIPAGIEMAMRHERYDAVLGMAADAIPEGSQSPSVPRALCTIVSKFTRQ